MKKRKIMRLMSFIMTLCLVWTTCLPGVRAAGTPSENDRYDGGYDIYSVLSQFQYFVSGDSTLNMHTVGGIVVGGKLNTGFNFGDAAIVPSYINKVENAGSGISSNFIGNQQCNIVYYGDSNVAGLSGQWQQNPDYMDVDTAFKEVIQKESSNLAGFPPSTVNPKKITPDADGNVTIDCTGNEDVYVVVDYTGITGDIDLKINIQLAGTKEAPYIRWFQQHVCCISISGINSKAVTFYGYGNITYNGEQIGNKMMNEQLMPGGIAGTSGQANFDGMNLVWNFPDATGTITATSLEGHMVAPQASVNVYDRYEGGIIAASITGNAEGHFYPMNKALKTTGTTTPGGDTGTTTPGGDTGTTTPGGDTGTTTPGGDTGTTTPGGNTGTTDPGTTNPGGDTGATDPGTSTGTDTPSTETGDLEIVVQDEKTGDPVPNAKVEIVYPNGRRDTATTDENGKITKKGLEPGDYTITVTEVPDGYTVTTGKQEKATVVAGGTTQHVVKINSEGAANAEKEDDEDDEDDTDDGGEAEAASRNAAKTGDAFPIAVPVVLLIGAATTMFILGYKKRYE